MKGGEYAAKIVLIRTLEHRIMSRLFYHRAAADWLYTPRRGFTTVNYDRKMFIRFAKT